MHERTAALALIATLWACCVHANEINDARLQAADKERTDWILPGRDYSNQRFSPLRQITANTVKRLVPAWIHQTGIAATFQTTPLVADGVMYVSTPFSHVTAIDAASGRKLWHYEHQRDTARMCCGPANRGVGLGYGKVFVATIDAHLVALDQKSGKKLWDVKLAAPYPSITEDQKFMDPADPLAKAEVAGSTGVAAVMEPLVFKETVIVGITGVGYGLHLESSRPGAPLEAVVGIAGRYGRPGFIAAYSAQTGEKIWQFDTTQEGWEGRFVATTDYGVALPRDLAAEKADAAKFNDAWRYGGGSVWSSPAVDVDRGLIFFGVGNPSPQAAGDTRPGDNLYTSSLVALEATTGKVAWYYQQVPHDLWGYDVASPPLLFDAVIDGKTVPAVGQASKLGWYFVHDRRDGKLLYRSDPFVPQENMFSPPTEAGTRIAPGAGGGANWSPTSYNPQKGLVYVAAMHMPFVYRKKALPATGDKPAIAYHVFERSDEPNWGVLSAIDVQHRGRILWQQKTEDPLIGGTLATAGGLVFMGEGSGDFSAFDATSGERLWHFNCGAGVNAPPISYMVGGKQYIAVAAGGSKIWGYQQGDAVIAFSLSE
jgi:alcohol dehydrogenase (cytochrome c)